MKSLIIGLGQINSTVGDFSGNARKIISYLELAERGKVDLIIFPELAVSGYPVWDLANKKSFVEAGLKALAEIVKATRTIHAAVAVGFIDRASANHGKTHNAIALIHRGKVIHKQYKTLLPTYDVFLEEIFFARETRHQIFRLKNIPMGASICEDIWDDPYAVKPAKILAGRGARVLINISASPYHRNVAKVREELIRRKAREYGLWIVYVNQVGGQDDLIFDGRSFICDPKGRICFQAEAFEEGFYRFELHLTAKQIRLEPLRRSDPAKEMYQALSLGLSDYVRKNRFQRVAVGLSGGVDSALVASIAADALGADRVIGVGMPGPFSSPGSLRDAKKLAQNLGIEFRILPIRSEYRRLIDSTAQEKKSRSADVRERASVTLAMENLQARLRGLKLMYLSNDEKLLLLTTGNKSELAMGYCTLYGDMCGGLSVLGDVYKTDVYRLARWRNSISNVIPQATLIKAPSAELRPNQKDQDSLPPYSVLDQILYGYIEANQSYDELCKRLARKGISGKTIRRVILTVDHNEYKRRQLPPLLRVTEKAWFGRRMPITNQFEV